MKITLQNQSLNLLRQFLGLAGVAKTAKEIYQDGELLCVTLPAQDLSWVLSASDKAALTPKALAEYVARDSVWATTVIEFEVTEQQRERIKAALGRVPEIAAVPQSEFVFRLYKEFGFAP